MANDTHSIGFFAAEVLARRAQQYPDKTALISKEEKLSFSLLDRQVHALATHLQLEGIHRGQRVGVLLPNCTAIPLIYFATQKIGVVTVILDARLKGKELQAVLTDSDLSLLVVHQQLFSAVEQAFKQIPAVPLWIVEGVGEEAFEKRFSALAQELALPQLGPDDDALIL